MTLLGRQVAGLVLAAAGLVLATSASVMLVQPVLAPQGVPDTQAAPPPAPPGPLPPAAPPATGDRSDRADDPAPAPDQADVPDELVLDDDPMMLRGIPHRPTATPSDRQDHPDIVEVPDIPTATIVTAHDADVAAAEDPPSGGTPPDVAPHQDPPKAPDPRATDRRAGASDVAVRPDRGKPSFPAGWPWYERLGNQGNGKGFGPPGGAR